LQRRWTASSICVATVQPRMRSRSVSATRRPAGSASPRTWSRRGTASAAA